MLRSEKNKQIYMQKVSFGLMEWADVKNEEINIGIRPIEFQLTQSKLFLQHFCFVCFMVNLCKLDENQNKFKKQRWYSVKSTQS